MKLLDFLFLWILVFFGCIFQWKVRPVNLRLYETIQKWIFWNRVGLICLYKFPFLWVLNKACPKIMYVTPLWFAWARKWTNVRTHIYHLATDQSLSAKKENIFINKVFKNETYFLGLTFCWLFFLFISVMSNQTNCSLWGFFCVFLLI